MTLEAVLIAATIWHEGRGEGNEAMRHIASTVVNNTRNGEIWQTATNPRLYSCWKNRKAVAPDPGKMLPADRRAWEYAVALVGLIERKQFNPVRGVRYYHDDSITEKRFRGKFLGGLVRVKKVGSLTFYREAK